ncbi:MAG: glycosyl transferase group 1 [Gemmatimonadetes bacterium]|nr:glycosyl transferase group 1 [Gemmatimonadota bacterium]
MDRRAVTGRPQVAHFAVAPEFVDRIMLLDLRRLRPHEDITVIATEGEALEGARREGFRVLTVNARRKLSPLFDLRTVWELWRIFRRERFDLLHTYTPKAGLLGQIAGALARIPRRIHGCRGLLYSEGMSSRRRTLLRVTDRITSMLAHRTLYLSAADRDYSVSEGLCASARAVLIGSGVELHRFVRSDATRRVGEAFRERLGFLPEHTVVLSVGRFVEDKGYREICAAAARLRTDYPQLRYLWVAPVLVGEDDVLPASLITDYGIDDLVRLTGYTNEILPALAAADLLLHPSRREGVPRVVMEAAALGIPVLASDIPGCREVVQDGESALLFAAGDSNALEAAMQRALRDPGATAARAVRAAADVRARFDQDALTRRVWSVHESVLGAEAGLMRSSVPA